MTKEIIIILLLIALIYLYYQNKKLQQLPPGEKLARTIFEVGEDHEELIAEKDAAIRSKNEAQAEVLSLTNRLKNKQQEVSRKETEIERLKKEKSNSEISLNKKITELRSNLSDLQGKCDMKNGLITTQQKELNQLKEKYSKQGKLLDEEQLEGKKLEEQITKLKEQITELTRSKSPIPGEFPTDELEQKHQEQLRKINLLFDENAENYAEIDFNGLYELLKGVAERVRSKTDIQSPKKK